MGRMESVLERVGRVVAQAMMPIGHVGARPAGRAPRCRVGRGALKTRVTFEKPAVQGIKSSRTPPLHLGASMKTSTEIEAASMKTWTLSGLGHTGRGPAEGQISLEISRNVFSSEPPNFQKNF